jgi:hypothetical protein
MSWLWVAVAIRNSKRRRQRRRRQQQRYLPDPWEITARFPYGQIPPPPSPRKGRKR